VDHTLIVRIRVGTSAAIVSQASSGLLLAPLALLNFLLVIVEKILIVKSLKEVTGAPASQGSRGHTQRLPARIEMSARKILIFVDPLPHV